MVAPIELTAWGRGWLNGSQCRGASMGMESSGVQPLTQSCGKGAGSRGGPKPRAAREALVPELSLGTGSLDQRYWRERGLRL